MHVILALVLTGKNVAEGLFLQVDSQILSHAGALESDLMLIRFKWVVFSLIVSSQ